MRCDSKNGLPADPRGARSPRENAEMTTWSCPDCATVNGDADGSCMACGSGRVKRATVDSLGPHTSSAPGSAPRRDQGAGSAATLPSSGPLLDRDAIIERMVDSIADIAAGNNTPFNRREQVMFFMSISDALRHPRPVRKLRKKFLPLLATAIERDPSGGEGAVVAPSGMSVSSRWWNDYVALEEANDKSVMIFLLDDLFESHGWDWLS